MRTWLPQTQWFSARTTSEKQRYMSSAQHRPPTLASTCSRWYMSVVSPRAAAQAIWRRSDSVTSMYSCDADSEGSILPCRMSMDMTASRCVAWHGVFQSEARWLFFKCWCVVVPPMQQQPHLIKIDGSVGEVWVWKRKGSDFIIEVAVHKVVVLVLRRGGVKE